MVAQDLISKLMITPDSLPRYSWSQQILRFQGRQFVGATGPVPRQIRSDLHAAALGGNSGVKAIVKRISTYIFWHSMYRDIKQ